MAGRLRNGGERASRKGRLGDLEVQWPSWRVVLEVLCSSI